MEQAIKDLPTTISRPMIDTSEMEKGTWDMQAYIRSLPTREDMDSYVYRLETLYKAKLQSLKISVQNTQEKINILDAKLSVMEQKLTQVEARCKEQDHCLKDATTIIDDLENRNRWNNIGVRGLPEATSPEELMPTLRGIFNTLLQCPPTTELILDQAHRSLGPKSTDPAKLRDVNCRIHYFHIKEKIIAAAHQRKTIDFHGTQLILLQDLFRHTLALRKAMKPFLEILQEKNIFYI